MCFACETTSASRDWTEAGYGAGADGLRGRAQTHAAIAGVLSAYGLKLQLAAPTGGFKLTTPSGRYAYARSVGEVWREAAYLAGRSLDPLDALLRQTSAPNAPDAVGPRARVTLICGFSGAGKTTWLRHQTLHGAFQQARVIINEAAECSFDDALPANWSVLAGGCACCERKSALIKALRDLSGPVRRRPVTSGDYSHIVVEANGLADPRPILDAIREDALLVRRAEVAEVITLLAASDGLDLLRSEALVRRQIECADCVVVSKCEAADEREMTRLLGAIRAINPHAALFGASRGADFALPAPDEAAIDAFAALAESTEPTTCVRLDVSTVGWPIFSVWLSALLHAHGHDISRLEGVVRTPAGRLRVHVSRQEMSAPEILSEPFEKGDGTIAVTGRNVRHEHLAQSLRAFLSAAQGSSQTIGTSMNMIGPK